ncbi:hypothetical protein, partial [uncultured Prevotella sp.]|uniref:hypothetical protein n=1 Tax=uncultured Prevotella sp. TaxID=159272 RepID=UPI0025953B35
ESAIWATFAHIDQLKLIPPTGFIIIKSGGQDRNIHKNCLPLRFKKRKARKRRARFCFDA